MFQVCEDVGFRQTRERHSKLNTFQINIKFKLKLGKMTIYIAFPMISFYVYYQVDLFEDQFADMHRKVMSKLPQSMERIVTLYQSQEVGGSPVPFREVGGSPKSAPDGWRFAQIRPAQGRRSRSSLRRSREG